jgi:carboxymethylenebutenolidase
MPDAMVKLNDDTMGFEAGPDTEDAVPGVLVMHEVTGLNDYIKDVCRSLAEHGYLGLAVDLYRGKTAQGMEDGAPLRDAVTDDVFRTKVGAAIDYLKASPQCSGRIGVIGFCMGGGNSLKTACMFGADIHACAIFYGRISDLSLLQGLACPIIGNFGGEDRGITSWALHDLRPAVQHMGKSLNMKIYPGAPHGFARHTTPNAYQPEAAQDAWDRSFELFGRVLSRSAQYHLARG